MSKKKVTVLPCEVSGCVYNAKKTIAKGMGRVEVMRVCSASRGVFVFQPPCADMGFDNAKKWEDSIEVYVC